MTELEKLLEQRKEINRKIKEMENEAVTCGIVRIIKRQRRTNAYIAQVNVSGFSESGYRYSNYSDTRWFMVAQGGSKTEVIDKLRLIRHDINSLLNGEGVKVCAEG